MAGLVPTIHAASPRLSSSHAKQAPAVAALPRVTKIACLTRGAQFNSQKRQADFAIGIYNKSEQFRI